jgi:hypothetical protein
MHTHFSAVAATSVFLVVLVLGSVWRLAALHLAASDKPQLRNLGLAMAFQY